MRSTTRVRTWLRLGVAALAATAATAVLPAHAATDPLTADQWGLDLVGARAAWSVGRGAGVTIAVVDSGTDLNHEDLKPNIVGGKSYVSATPQDDDGHGSHVSGIAAGVGNNGVGISGVAPEAKIMPVKVLTPDGGTLGDIADAIRYAADAGAQVINLSLGAEVPIVTGLSSTLPDAIRYAWSKGSICVLAAGNNSLPLSDYGNLPAIVVTAVDRNDQRAGYATAVGGARWGLAAPGGAGTGDEDDVLSTYWFEGKSNSYARIAGTSMAAPFVSGAAAILRGLGLSPQATVDKLLATAKDLGASGRDGTFGSGRLDVARAISGLGGSGGTTQTTGASSTPEPTQSGGSTRTTRPRSSGSKATTSTTQDLAAVTSTSDATTTTTIEDEPESPSLQASRTTGDDNASEDDGFSPGLLAGGIVAVLTATTLVLLNLRSRRSLGG